VYQVRASRCSPSQDMIAGRALGAAVEMAVWASADHAPSASCARTTECRSPLGYGRCNAVDDRLFVGHRAVSYVVMK
jgi:hypothetical protein